MTWVFRSRRLQYLSTVRTVSVSIEESDCVFQRRRAQVHVHLGRRQIRFKLSEARVWRRWLVLLYRFYSSSLARPAGGGSSFLRLSSSTIASNAGSPRREARALSSRIHMFDCR